MVSDFIAGLPKCELHVHIEGTLELSMQQRLADRHRRTEPGRAAGGASPPVEAADADAAAASGASGASGTRRFGTLASFLADYYQAMEVLVDEDDFFDLTMAYLTRARQHQVLYCEMFFDPQAHTSRGIAFDTVIRGIHRAQVEGAASLGIESQLIMCFLRDHDAGSAMDTLQRALLYRDWIVGVGLDSDENGNPPVKFLDVFEQARAEGFHRTMHCDPRQPDSLEHLRQCLDVVAVERIDHGVSCLQDDAISHEIARRGLGLTVCPLSNRQIYGDLMATEMAEMLARGLRVTCNSDDPAYFGGYMNDNFQALSEAGFTHSQLAQLAKNAFSVAWLPQDRRDAFVQSVDRYVQTFAAGSGDSSEESGR